MILNTSKELSFLKDGSFFEKFSLGKGSNEK